MEIKVLGPGCARCEQVEKLIREVADRNRRGSNRR